jgi:hypothetical protein
MSYTNTFIKVADDCPLNKSEIPVSKKDKKPLHLIQYELLKQNPYKFDHEGLIYEVYVRQKEIPENVLEKEAEKIKTELFSKGHPCLRASALMKRYGFGAHYNEEGKIAIYPMESEEYKTLMADKGIKVLSAMKTKK